MGKRRSPEKSVGEHHLAPVDQFHSRGREASNARSHTFLLRTIPNKIAFGVLEMLQALLGRPLMTTACSRWGPYGTANEEWLEKSDFFPFRKGY
jgi:hypothetical protein